MRKSLIRKVIEGLFDNYNWSDISKLGQISFDEYILRLNPNQTKVFGDGEFKRIQWEDEQTLYIVRFSKSGEFVMIEREVWYEYQLPFFKKKIILDERIG